MPTTAHHVFGEIQGGKRERERELSERLILSEEKCWNHCLHFLEIISNNFKKNSFETERGNLSSFVFSPRRACLVFWFFPFWVPWDRGSLSIKQHLQSPTLLCAGRCTQILLGKSSFPRPLLVQFGCSGNSQCPSRVDTPEVPRPDTSKQLFFVFVASLKRYWDSHVSGTAQDVGQPWLCPTGGRIKAVHPGHFQGLQVSLWLKRIMNSWAVCSGSPENNSHTSWTADLPFKYLMIESPIETEQNFIYAQLYIQNHHHQNK